MPTQQQERVLPMDRLQRLMLANGMLVMLAVRAQAVLPKDGSDE